MFLVDSLDSAVHYLAGVIGKPDGTFSHSHIFIRLDATTSVFFRSLSFRMDNEFPDQWQIGPPSLRHHFRHHSLDFHVQRSDLPPLYHDDSHLPIDGMLA